MSWPYHFYLNPTDAEKAARRHALDRYALVAHVSALAPAVAYFAYSLAKSALSSRGRGKGSYESVPDSPTQETRRQSNARATNPSSRKLQWWLKSPVMLGPNFMGRRDQWLFALGWAAWMVFLCFAGTGDGE
jgi:hypothetical protein